MKNQVSEILFFLPRPSLGHHSYTYCTDLCAQGVLCKHVNTGTQRYLVNCIVSHQSVDNDS